jgi:Icc-related predicted phosphoesterase
MNTLRMLLLVCCLVPGLQAVAQNQPISNPDKKAFRFFINADPQMGPQNTNKPVLKKLNSLLQAFVDEVNEVHHEKPVEFVVYNGDLVWDAYQDAFDNFTRIVSQQQVPTHLVHGNHDGILHDPKFFQAQKKLSGFEKLNYAFTYGDWRMVVMGAQEKYPTEKLKEQQLQWLKNELLSHADKQVMLFMHYHVTPIGLSQMEHYSYTPNSFKTALLSAITEHGNVKYAFSGHVHSGIKASIKSSVEYQGTQFVVVPTPVMARPFGEEFAVYEMDKKDPFYRRGFYLEVEVDGDQVKLIGHKINHKHTVTYPDQLKKLKVSDDPRFFVSEGQMDPESTVNLDFAAADHDWIRTYRYKKDQSNAFINVFRDGVNRMKLVAPWGAWNFDEYMESYVPLSWNADQPTVIHYELETPKFNRRGSGGYIRVFLYDQQGNFSKGIMLYWGAAHKKNKFTWQSHFYHATGDRVSGSFINKNLANNSLYLKELKFIKKYQHQEIEIQLNAILQHLADTSGGEVDLSEFSHMVLAHGVWSSLNRVGTPITSELTVNQVRVGVDEGVQHGVKLNGRPLLLKQKAHSNPFFQY